MKTIGTLLALFLLSGSVMTAQQRDVRLETWGVRLSLPEGWVLQDTTALAEMTAPSRLTATDSTGQSMTLHIVDAPRWWVATSPEVQKRIDNSMIGGGTTITSKKVVRHAGEDAYRFEGVWEGDAMRLNVGGIFLLANGYGYSLSFTTLAQQSPFENPQVTAIIGSFGFTDTPLSHVNPDTLRPYTIDRRGVSLTVPGAWQDIPVDPERDGPLVVRAADMTRERAIYIERIPAMPSLAPDDSLLVAEMTGRLERSGFSLTSPPEVTTFRGRPALSLRAGVDGEALAHFWVVPSGQSGEVGTTVMVVLQGERLKGITRVNDDPVVRSVLESLTF